MGATQAKERRSFPERPGVTSLAKLAANSLCDDVLVLVLHEREAPDEKGTRMQATQSGVCKPGLPPQL